LYGVVFSKKHPPPELAALVGCGPASVQAWGRMSFKIWRYKAPKLLVAKN
jgi:hypothetical protein